MKVSLAGGPALTILQDPLSRFGRAHAWGPDDTIVFGTDSGLFQVSANGGDAEPLTTPESEGESHFDPRFLPAGKALLFVLRSPPANDNQLAVYSFETGESRQLLVAGLRPRYSLGHIVFARLDSLWAVPFDANRLEITGDPFLVLQGVAAFTGFASQFDMAHDGTLVYVPTGALGSRRERTLGWVDRDGVSTPLRDEPRVYYAPRFSPDGRRLLLRISDTDRGTNDLWVQDVERDTLTPLTFEGSPNEFPIWTSDGERVTFTSARGEEPMQLYERPADGSGDVELLLDKEGRQYPSSWSPDGTVLAFIDIHPDTGDDIWLLEDGVPRAFIATDASETMAMFSPDGQWLAYQSNKSGPNEVYLTPYPGPGGEQQVSTEGGRSPVWSPDGSELFYRTDAGQVLSVSVQTTPLVELSAAQLLFEIPNMASMDSANSAFDVHPDGERFVVVRSVGSESSTTQINVVLNWLEERAERVPTP